MRMTRGTAWLGLALLPLSLAAPAQIILGGDSPAPSLPPPITNTINPLHHLAAISPFFTNQPHPDPLPTGCKLTSVSILIRHSSIFCNDEEWEQAMEPFVKKLGKLQEREDLVADKKWPEGDAHQWTFLREWKSPIDKDMLEKLSDEGKSDAKKFGKHMRVRYHSLFPPNSSTATTSSGPSYKVWTASSSRDVDSARSYIKGAFPPHQAGPDGEGDGKVVQLLKVPNKEVKEWDRSLTPHKVCPAFEKEPSLKPAGKWLKVFGGKIRNRLATVMPGLAPEFDDQDVLGMMMLCGYESITSGSSPFCEVFTDDEWLDAEYYFDIRYHWMMGYGNPLSPYLGIPWVKTASHLLAGREAHQGPGKEPDDAYFGKDKLPKPKLPPNGTHSQTLHPFFTHRESPAFVATALNLFNATGLISTPASVDPPLDHRPPRAERQWRTSHLVPFLGHIALERFECKAEEGSSLKRHKDSFVWALVNGKHERMTGCEDGVDGSCSWEKWEKWVSERGEKWKGWGESCHVDKKAV